jgi:hypothetical protein
MTEKEIIGKMNDFWAQSGKSKAEMSRELGVDAGTFGNILNGNRGVSAGLLSKFLETYPSVSAEWLMRGIGSMYAADGRVGSENIANNNNSQINAGDTINRLVSLLEEKDKQINQLLQILAAK